jgi:DNA-directed RNA polymerase specialized sigma24 family protein
MSIYRDDAALLYALKGKEAERNRALQYLVQSSGWRIQAIKYVLANSGTQEDGEEIFFDALTAFDRNIREDKFEGRSAANTYFMQIVKFRWLKQLAKRNMTARTVAWESADHESLMEWSVERYFIMAEHESVFGQVMAQIGARCQRIFALFHLGHTMAEIAIDVGISDADQAKKEKNRCKNRLLNVLEERPELRNFFKE